MLDVRRSFLVSAILLLGFFPIAGQSSTGTGAVEVSGRVKIEGKLEKLTRKRFYLFPGGLEGNKDLVARIKAAEIVSRDCFYKGIKASDQFICWLSAENCESPFCRTITADDVKIVPEFSAAYQKGLRLYGRKPSIAQLWLTTNLPAPFTSGFYNDREARIKEILGTRKSMQSSMTDTKSVKAVFIDIPLEPASSAEKVQFLISNLVPIEIGNKSYVWSCEVDVGPAKTAVVRLGVPENGKPVKDCDVSVKELPVCKTGDCTQK
ncbi:MAG: hypothetical protein WBD22_11975 [Pyrinomonadaceae bacterium]